MGCLRCLNMSGSSRAVPRKQICVFVNFVRFPLILGVFVSIFIQWVCGGLVVSVLDCQSRGSGFKSRPVQKFGSRFLLHLCPLANSAMMNTWTTHCHWEDEMVKETTGHPPSYAEAKKIKSLTLHTHGFPKASLRDCSALLV